MPGFLDNMMRREDRTPEMILSELLTAKDIEMKTEIQQPINLAKLYVVGEVLKTEGFPRSGQTIHDFISKMNLYFVSHNRMSRTEAIEGLKAIRGKELDQNLIQ